MRCLYLSIFVLSSKLYLIRLYSCTIFSNVTASYICICGPGCHIQFHIHYLHCLHRIKRLVYLCISVLTSCTSVQHLHCLFRCVLYVRTFKFSSHVTCTSLKISARSSHYVCLCICVCQGLLAFVFVFCTTYTYIPGAINCLLFLFTANGLTG